MTFLDVQYFFCTISRGRNSVIPKSTVAKGLINKERDRTALTKFKSCGHKFQLYNQNFRVESGIYIRHLLLLDKIAAWGVVRMNRKKAIMKYKSGRIECAAEIFNIKRRREVGSVMLELLVSFNLIQNIKVFLMINCVTTLFYKVSCFFFSSNCCMR